MPILYITPQGIQSRLDNAEALQKAIHLGLLSSRSQVYNGTSRSWVPAMEHPQLAACFPTVPPSVPPRLARGPLILGGLVWLGGLTAPAVIAAHNGADLKDVVGGTIASCVTIALVGLGVLRLLRRLTGRGIHWPLWSLVGGLVFCAFDATVLPRMLAEQIRLHMSARSLQEALQTVAPPAAAGGSSASLSPDTAAASRGTQLPLDKRARLLDAMSQLLKDSNALEEQYTRSLDGITVAGMVSPSVLVDKKRLRDGYGHLDAWEQAVTRHAHDRDEMLTRYASQMTALGATPDDSNADERFRRMDEIERSVTSEIRLLYDFMKTRAGTVRLHGQKLTFRSAADRDAYRTHMARIQELGRESDDLGREMEQERQTALAHVRDMATAAAAQ